MLPPQATSWEKQANEILAERLECQGVFEKHQLNLSEFDKSEFYKRHKAADDRSFYARITHDLDKTHPVKPLVAKEDAINLLTSAMQDNAAALDDVDILDDAAECGENDKVSRRLAVFDAEQDDNESVNGIDDDEDEPQSVVEACSWKGFRISADMFAQLQDHQREGLMMLIDRADKNAGTLLAHAPGLGKTLTTLCFLSCLKFYRKSCRSIVVCDKSLLLQWEAQVDKFNSFLHLQVFTVDDSAKLFLLHSQWKRSNGGVLLIGTDLFRAQFETENTTKRKEAATSKRSREKASTSRPKCEIQIDADTAVVVDEAHKFLQTGNSELYKIVSNHLATNLRVLLTGTPLQHSLSKYYNMVKLIAPDLLPATNLLFDEKYARKITKGITKGATQDDKHDSNLTMHILVKDLEDAVAYKMADAVLKDMLPPKVEFLITHPLDKGAGDYADWTGSGMDKREKVHTGTRDTKTIIFKCLLYRFALTDRSIVFSSRVATLKHMMEACQGNARHCALLTGETTNIYDRNAIVYEFCETPGSVLFLSTELGACGLDLSAANRVIILDVSWNPMVEEQAVARAYRVGQEKNVYVYRLCAAGTVEEQAYKLGIAKRRLASTIDGESNVSCAYVDADLIIGSLDLDADKRKFRRVVEDYKHLEGHAKAEVDRVPKVLLEDMKACKIKINWSVHDVNVIIKDQRNEAVWIMNQYKNELNRQLAVDDAMRELDWRSSKIDTLYDNATELVTPTPIAFLNGPFLDGLSYPCVNFTYPSVSYRIEEDEDEDEVNDERNMPHAKLIYKHDDENAEIYGVFAPSPAICLANGIDFELYRLKLKPNKMDPTEYNEKDWKRMEITLSELVTGVDDHTECAIKMTDILDTDGIYLFATGSWVYKIRLVDANGNISLFSPPSAIVEIKECEDTRD